MARTKSLADRFAEAQSALHSARLAYEQVRHAYFQDRIHRIRAGEVVEPLAVTDGMAFENQLRRENIARSNAEEDPMLEAHLLNLNAQPDPLSAA
jgi:hypothetical protein